MARDISVYRADDIESRSGGNWRVREGAVCLFDAPLGSESAVRVWWSEPAVSLGLPLLSTVYGFGFDHSILWDGPQLKRVLDELALLEEHWASTDLSPDAEYNFAARADYLRQAVVVAQGCDGFVVIV
jgi:hypothetical protein